MLADSRDSQWTGGFHEEHAGYRKYGVAACRFDVAFFCTGLQVNQSAHAARFG